jgi:hypothetical protein
LKTNKPKSKFDLSVNLQTQRPITSVLTKPVQKERKQSANVLSSSRTNMSNDEDKNGPIFLQIEILKKGDAFGLNLALKSDENSEELDLSMVTSFYFLKEKEEYFNILNLLFRSVMVLKY